MTMENKQGKRKKKQNFRRQAKHYQKKGLYGKGHKLTEEQYGYFISIFEEMKRLEGEEKELLVRNFLNEVINGEEVKKSASNQIVSRILDDALPFGEITQLLSLCRIFSEDVRSLCLDPYASHVLQTLMALSLKFAQKNAVQKNATQEGEAEEDEIKVSKEQRKEFISFLNKIGRFVYNNLDEFINDTYGSHVFRSVMEVCSGVQVKDSIRSSRKSQTKHELSQDVGQILRVPSDLRDLHVDIATRILKLPDLPDVITSECSSASLQATFLVLRGMKSEYCSTLVDHVLMNGFPNVKAYSDEYEDTEDFTDLPNLFHSSPAVHLLEVMMSCATVQQLNDIYVKYFQSHMQSLVKHKYGNFSVQKLLSVWQEKDTFYDLFEKVKEALPAAFKVKHTGVILAMAQICRTLGKNQGQCWKALAELLGCYEPMERKQAVAPCLVWFLNFDDYQEKISSKALPSVSLHGSLILQEFLQFNRTQQVVESILSMSSSDLLLLACDPRGSHVVEAFLSSTFIKVNNKEKLSDMFKGSYVILACSKHGSRSLEAIWSIASIKLKTSICEDLSNEELKLKGNKFGTIIFSKFMVRMFKRKDKQDWQQLVDSAAKKKRLLDDLLQDVTNDEPKKKKKKKKNSADEPEIAAESP